jgi:hypothetical protein
MARAEIIIFDRHTTARIVPSHDGSGCRRTTVDYLKERPACSDYRKKKNDKVRARD